MDLVSLPIGTFVEEDSTIYFSVKCALKNSVIQNIIKSDLTFTLYSKEEERKGPLLYLFKYNKKMKAEINKDFILFNHKTNVCCKPTKISSAYDDRYCRLVVIEYNGVKHRDFIFVLKHSTALKEEPNVT